MAGRRPPRVLPARNRRRGRYPASPFGLRRTSRDRGRGVLNHEEHEEKKGARRHRDRNRNPNLDYEHDCDYEMLKVGTDRRAVRMVDWSNMRRVRPCFAKTLRRTSGRALPFFLRTHVPRPDARRAFGPHPSFLHGEITFSPMPASPRPATSPSGSSEHKRGPIIKYFARGKEFQTMKSMKKRRALVVIVIVIVILISITSTIAITKCLR